MAGMIKKHLKKIVIVIAVLAVLLIGIGGIVAMQPDEFRIVRSTTINAPPEAAFGLVDDFHKWDAWSPWAKIDPNVKNTFEGPARGQGSVFKWSGDDKVGEGSMVIIESLPAQRVRLTLTFIRPFPGVNDVDFAFKPGAGQTQVTWAMAGRNNFVGKAFCMFMNMDKMVGGDFEKGLASMKQAAEESVKASPTTAK